KTIAHHLENLLNARLDDARQLGPRHEPRRFTVLPADGRHGNHVAFVRSSGQYTAIERFDSLGVVHAGTQTARNIEGYMAPADRETVGMDETPIRKYRHRGGAGAHVDDGGSEIGFIICQGRRTCRVGTSHHRLDHEMAAFYRK